MVKLDKNASFPWIFHFWKNSHMIYILKNRVLCWCICEYDNYDIEQTFLHYISTLHSDVSHNFITHKLVFLLDLSIQPIFGLNIRLC